MHITSVVVRCSLVAACSVAMSMSCLATPICWIDRIVKADGGIDVYFVRNAMLTILVMENPGAATTQYGAHDGVVRDAAGREQDHLFVKDGAEFSAVQMAHDSCSYKVDASGEIGKVRMKSAMHLPGLPSAFATQTIRTDGTETD